MVVPLPPGAVFPILHYDNSHVHAFLTQIHGEKEFVCFGPEQTAFLYPGEGKRSNNSLMNDVERPDLARFPLFRRARPLRATLYPGETIFLPGGWWHTTRMNTVSITVSMNTANWGDWREFRQDYCVGVRQRRTAMHAAAVSAYLTVMGYLERFAEILAGI
jgi:hypothetical protein